MRGKVITNLTSVKIRNLELNCGFVQQDMQHKCYTS